MQVGLMEGMVRFSTLQKEDMCELKAKLVSWDEQLEKESDSINVEFLEGVIEIFRTRSKELLAALDPFDNIKPYLRLTEEKNGHRYWTLFGCFHRRI